ncbi:PEP-utilizing enzyme [Nocardioides sp. NPDC101246]|uniref:PEP-utilizing enzyme n=1 Tax=Nocardioides sp. NPDC101246 TaxID=3364336 RepID=UPI003820F993
MSEQIGTGTPSFRFERTEGVVRRFTAPSDVIASFDDDLSGTIALVASGGTTFLSPILGRLGGIVALDGTLRSHLAIVSREFDVPCLVGASVEQDLSDGTTISLVVVDDGTAIIEKLPEGATL